MQYLFLKKTCQSSLGFFFLKKKTQIILRICGQMQEKRKYFYFYFFRLCLVKTYFFVIKLPKTVLRGVRQTTPKPKTIFSKNITS